MNEREHAIAQWTANACGEVDGPRKDTLEYFLKVESERYKQQQWQHSYFDFGGYSKKQVLEIGTGHGTDLLQFARGGAICSGVDITKNHLRLTKANFAHRGYQVNLFEADAANLPFEDASFDCIYSFGVIHHIPDPEKVIKECFRVLKPGGKIMVTMYYKWSAFAIFIKFFNHGLKKGWVFSKGMDGLLATIETGADGKKIKPFVKLYSKKSLMNLMASFKVKNISIHQLEADHFWPPFLQKFAVRKIKELESRWGWYVACTAEK